MYMGIIIEIFLYNKKKQASLNMENLFRANNKLQNILKKEIYIITMHLVSIKKA